MDELNYLLDNVADFNQFVDELFDRLSQRGFDWGEPNARDFALFLNSFATNIQYETKKVTDGVTSPQQRAEVIRHIRERVETYHQQPVFAGINKYVFAMQLAMRVRRPRTFDQGNTGLCGAVAAMYLFAKTRPIEFIHMALDLFFTGRALFGSMEIQPSDVIRNGYRLRRTKIRWAFDYVVLVSLRQCTFFSDQSGLGFLRTGDETAMPGQMAQWLAEAGYSNVEDHTFFGKNQIQLVRKFAKTINQPVYGWNNTAGEDARTDRQNHLIRSLSDAINALRDGKLVILFSDGKIADFLQEGDSINMTARTGPVGLGKHHWTVVRKLHLVGGKVRIKVITWGTSHEGDFNIAAFTSRYSGYISADPVG
jgi:hypothetical protein